MCWSKLPYWISLCSLSTNRPKFGVDFKKFYYLMQLFVFVCFLTLWTGVSPITGHESLIFYALVVMTLISVCSFMWWAGVSPISVIIILGSVIKTALRRARSERKYFFFHEKFLISILNSVSSIKIWKSDFCYIKRPNYWPLSLSQSHALCLNLKLIIKFWLVGHKGDERTRLELV